MNYIVSINKLINVKYKTIQFLIVFTVLFVIEIFLSMFYAITGRSDTFLGIASISVMILWFASFIAVIICEEKIYRKKIKIE